MDLSAQEYEYLDHNLKRAAQGRSCETDSDPVVQSLVAKGLYERVSKAWVEGEGYYTITGKGREAYNAHPKPPRRSYGEPERFMG